MYKERVYRKCRNSSTWVRQFRDMETVTEQGGGWTESVEGNDGNTLWQEGTSKDHWYDIKEGCEFGNDVWTGLEMAMVTKGQEMQIEVPEMRLERFSMIMTGQIGESTSEGHCHWKWTGWTEGQAVKARSCETSGWWLCGQKGDVEAKARKKMWNTKEKIFRCGEGWHAGGRSEGRWSVLRKCIDNPLWQSLMRKPKLLSAVWSTKVWPTCLIMTYLTDPCNNGVDLLPVVRE